MEFVAPAGFTDQVEGRDSSLLKFLSTPEANNINVRRAMKHTCINRVVPVLGNAFCSACWDEAE